MSGLPVGKAERNLKPSAKSSVPTEVLEALENRGEQEEDMSYYDKRNHRIKSEARAIALAEERMKQQGQAYHEHHRRNSER